MNSPRRIPPVAAALIAAGAQMLSGHERPGRLRRFIAVTLGLMSAMFLTRSLREFRSNQTTVNPMAPERATSLVTSGPHRISRNPMYVGMAGALLTHALWRGSLVALTPVGAFVVYLNQGQIPEEERALRARFGPEFDAYAGQVRRWI